MTKIGVVGVGGMGRSHCNSLKNVNCEFYGVADIREEVVKLTASELDVKPFVDYNEMFKEVDGVIVATPPTVHKEVVVAAAQAGVHVFCEKPLSITLSDADEMIAAHDKAGTVFMVGQVLRFYPLHELGRKIIDDGEIGDIIYLETDYCGKYSGPRNKPDSWYGTIGGFLENGIHKSDLINWFGGKAESVSAEVGSFSGNKDWEDYAITLIRYDSEAVGVLRWGSFMGSRGSRATIIDGTKGSLKLDMASGNVYRKFMDESEWTELPPEDKGASGVVKEDQHFVDCIEANKPPIVDGRDGRHAVEVVLASYKSAKNGTKVSLPFMNLV